MRPSPWIHKEHFEDEVMNILDKFAVVEIKVDARISEQDKQFCERQQAAYTAALCGFQELTFFWEDMLSAQKALLGEPDSPPRTYNQYLVPDGDDGPKITIQRLRVQIDTLHRRFIQKLAGYFQSAYNVKVDEKKIVSELLLPRPPKSKKQNLKEYLLWVSSVQLHYEDIVVHILSCFDGRTPSEQSLQELCRRCNEDGRYTTEADCTLSAHFDVEREAQQIYERVLMLPKADLERNKSQILLELARSRDTSKNFPYESQKLLYQIKAHPATREHYARCCEYLHRFYTEKQPLNMKYEEWIKRRLTEKKVLYYLRRTLRLQNRKPERDVVALVKQNDQFIYKAYSAQARRSLTEKMRQPIPVYQAVLDDEPDRYPGFEALLRKKCREYSNQSQAFHDMPEDPEIAAWLRDFTLWDAENEEFIRLNDIQRQDINRILQKRYGMLQWEQGSGKTLAAIATAMCRMKKQRIHSAWVVSSAISIRNNWDVVLPNYGLPYVFVERLADLERIRPGDFVLITLNKLGPYQKQIKKWIKRHNQKICLTLDESDEISNPESQRTKASLACFRRCRMKLLTTGTSTRNNISEFAPQMELLYNNSINMITWCETVYYCDREDNSIYSTNNAYYGRPIPAYKNGYALFAACHLPEKTTVFGVAERTQDIYNADELNRLLAKTVITRTFEEVTGKEIRRIHQVPLPFLPEEREVYRMVVEEFYKVQREYFASTGNHRKDAMLRIMQQITLLLRVAAAPNTMKEYQGDTPLKITTAVEMAAEWEHEIVAVGVRHQNVLNAYAEAFREYLPNRPLFIVTGSTKTFAQRRALRKTLRDSGNGILLCTQQSLPSSVNFEYVNKILIPEMHFNNSGMSQFYMRFIRYTSTEYKDIYFLTYTGSLESNLLQMVIAKEKINLFMKGQDTDLDLIYDKFGIDYNLLALLLHRGVDEEGNFQIRWGDQQIA